MVNRKNLFGFFIMIFVACLIIIVIWSFTNKNNKNPNTNSNSLDNNETLENNKNEEKKYDEETSSKLEKINYINEKIDFFIMDNIDRYISYKELNPDLSDKDIIIRVNAGLDYKFYEKMVNAPYLNTTYIIANKYYALTSDYVPENMNKISSDCTNGNNSYMVEEARIAFEELCHAAKEQGYKIRSISAYRSYAYQESLYNRYVSQDGVAKVDTYSARPGHSEHQTGLATDVDNASTSYTNFVNTKEYNWMQDNSYLYGFILRYPADKTDITGYKYESWHYRYVGIDIAKYIHENNITYEEYYEMFIANKK